MKKDEARALIKNMQEIKEEISVLKNDMDDNLLAVKLAECIQKLNIYLVSLSPYINEMREYYELKKAQEEQSFTETYLKEIEGGSSQKNAEMIARQKRLEVTITKIPIEKDFRTLTDLKNDYERFVLGLNTRLSWLKVERMKEVS